LALAPGSVGRVSLVEASVEALDRASAEALADAALLVAGSPGAGDLPMVRLADSTVAAAACTAVAASTVAEGFTVAAADSTVVVAVMAADTGN
jgi:phosphoserine phosphatase